ncbi:methylmalonic aciduria and homocystinuria type D protein [Haematococcus lacustris]
MAPLAVGMTTTGIEWSVHACPANAYREISSVFPSLGPNLERLLIVPTCQHAAVDLVQTGDIIEQEKDALLEKFMAWASTVCNLLIAQGHWAEYIDPCSGLPMIQREGNTVYAEVEALSQLMGYKTANAGCCKVLLHPRWGSAVYPASLFTTAPPEQLLQLLQPDA